MDNSGWVKLHRSILEWEWYNDINTKILFIHLLLKTNFEEKKWKGVEVKRGQLITSIKHLSEQLKISEQSIKTSLKKLKSTNELTIKSTNKYTIITVCNFDNYQNEIIITNKQNNKQTNKQSTNNQQTTNKQLTTTKEIKNIKELNNIRNNNINIILDAVSSENLKKSIFEFYEYRKEIKKPLSERSLHKIIIQLSNYDENTAVEMINQTIRNGWQGLFELKVQKKININEKRSKLENLQAGSDELEQMIEAKYGRIDSIL